MEKLELVREKINALDQELIKVLAERIKLSDKVAESKIEGNLPQYQPEREEELIKNRQKIGREYGLDEEHVRAIFEEIIRESSRIQKQIMNK